MLVISFHGTNKTYPKKKKKKKSKLLFSFRLLRNLQSKKRMLGVKDFQKLKHNEKTLIQSVVVRNTKKSPAKMADVTVENKQH